MKRCTLSIVTLLILCAANAQVRFYADYSSLPFSDGSANNFKISTGIKLDPNKELILGLGLRGRFNPQKFDGNLRWSQSAFSVGFNYYQTRRLYANVDVSLSLLKNVVQDLVTNPFELDGEFYLNYKFNVSYIILRRFHLSTGMSIVDFTNLIVETGGDLLGTNNTRLNLSFALRVYMFQIKT